MIYLESESRNPYFNLAMEEYVFEKMDKAEQYFMLWQNENTIVVGKNQNVAEEINQQFVEHEVAGKYKYTNREDDVGEEGLRKAKLSYKPVFMVEKGVVTLKEDSEKECAKDDI